MAYNKSVTCAVRGCPHKFEVSVSRFGEDTEEARCPTSLRNHADALLKRKFRPCGGGLTWLHDWW